jgi:hypothetical protein
VKLKLEAFDLSDKGRNIPYFRREMVILHKVQRKPGIKIEDILNEFSREQIEGIYPALSHVMVQILVEELELMSYLEIREGHAVITKKGEAKLVDFRAGLSQEEKEALAI